MTNAGIDPERCTDLVARAAIDANLIREDRLRAALGNRAGRLVEMASAT